MRIRWGVLLAFCLWPRLVDAVEIQLPSLIVTGVPVEGSVSVSVSDSNATFQLWINDQPLLFDQKGEILHWQTTIPQSGTYTLEVHREGVVVARKVFRVFPGWITILPAAIAIVLAFATRQVVLSLFVGIWFGGWMLYAFAPVGLWYALLDSVERFVLPAVVPPDGDSDRVAILLFTLLIGGFVGIITKNGGATGIALRFQRFARSARSGQLATALLGVIFFFDDYANALVIGNTMRPITDRLRISREKLAYLVDSTAAPVASLMIMTTWIGFEVGLIQEAVKGIPDIALSGYEIFVASLAYRFYPIFALLLLFMVILMGRDIGPMWRAEVRARGMRPVQDREQIEANDTILPAARNALIPLAVLFGVLVWGLIVTGQGETVQQIIGSADSYTAMLWASLVGCIAAIVMGKIRGNFSIRQSMEAWMQGVQQMMLAVVVLLLAWGLAEINTTLKTTEYLATVLGTQVDPRWLPIMVFGLAALMSFATGSSWGVMALLMPLVIPLVWATLQAQHLEVTSSAMPILFASVAGVLAGSVWGDHCSPISDTTILSSIASGCPHMEHVRTQLPYALLAGGVSIVGGLLPVAVGVPWWIALCLGSAVLVFSLWFFGRPVPYAVEDESER